MFDTFDIESDFYSDPQMKILFAEEYKKKIPSRIMWSLVLLVHPKSQFSGLETSTAQDILKKDFIKDPKFNFDEYASTISKIIEYIPSTPERFLATWKRKLSEINSFINSRVYNEETHEMLSKMMKDFHPMMKQYKEIEKEFLKEQEATAKGGASESLSEKGLI